MKLGICQNLDKAEFMRNTGYSYVELNLTELTRKSDDDFNSFKESVTQSSLKPYAFNCFFPGDIRLTGDRVDWTIIQNYLEKSIFRASESGAQILVFGSGQARNVPDNFSMDKANQQLIDMLKLAGDIALDYHMTITIEPLHRPETNIIVTGKEGLDMVKRINHPNIRLVLDYYHMYLENEDSDIILDAGKEYLKHIHIANPAGRAYPKNPEESDYAKFFGNLKEIGYQGGVSIEANSDNIYQDAPLAFQVLSGFISYL